MAALVLLVLLFAMAGYSSATWCVCKDGLSDPVLQKTLDFACGAGADCNPTHEKGPCFSPNTVKAHCSYAVNSYFQKNRQNNTACDFAGTANIVNSDPSASGCAYPATASAAATTTTTTTTPGTGTTGNSPVVMTPNTGVLGGVNNGLGPSGNNDMSYGGLRLLNTVFSSSVVLAFSALAFW